MVVSQAAYLKSVERTRPKRMKWWNDARFGMFVHWGLYAQLGRHEWAMNIECIPKTEYEKLADTWKPKPRPMRAWARLAKKAGMKYMVMTTKHHEGFCLWDTRQTDYNAAKRGPGRDLVREYVEACREFGLKIGFYYSLMDWHHPDGIRCATDPNARRRFLDFTHGCVRELMTNYGKIDILWYDVSWPLRSPDAWYSVEMSSTARKLQPHILINDRAQLDEDFSTPEEHVNPADTGRGWEACMTFNRASWGYMPTAAPESYTARGILRMLHTCAAGQGNLLLNIGPAPDGSIPPEAVAPLTTVGQWLRKNGKAVYGPLDRCAVGGASACGEFSRKGNSLYFWCWYWPGTKLVLGGFKSRLARASLLLGNKPLQFEQTKHQIVIRGLPRTNPDKLAATAILKLDFKATPKHVRGATTMPF